MDLIARVIILDCSAHSGHTTDTDYCTQLTQVGTVSLLTPNELCTRRCKLNLVIAAAQIFTKFSSRCSGGEQRARPVTGEFISVHSL